MRFERLSRQEPQPRDDMIDVWRFLQWYQFVIDQLLSTTPTLLQHGRFNCGVNSWGLGLASIGTRRGVGQGQPFRGYGSRNKPHTIQRLQSSTPQKRRLQIIYPDLGI